MEALVRAPTPAEGHSALSSERAVSARGKTTSNGEKVATDAYKLGSAQVSDVSIDRNGIGRDLLPRR